MSEWLGNWDALEPFYYGIGGLLAFGVGVAASILYGRAEAMGRIPEESVYFWGAMLLGAFVMFAWPLFILSALAVLILRPIVQGLNKVGAKTVRGGE